MAWRQIPTFLQGKGGQVYLNPAKDYVQPFELTIDEPNNVFTLPAGGFAGPFPATAQFDGPIEIFYFKVNVKDSATLNDLTDYNIRWLIENPGKRKQYMNRSIPLIASAGDAGRPYVLPETIFLPVRQSLNMTFFNDDGADRNIEIVLGGIKYYPNAAPEKIRDQMYEYILRRERTYTYFQTTDAPVVIPAGGTGTRGLMRIPDDADLEIFKATAHATSAAGFRIRIRDSQNDRGMQNNEIHSSLMFGGHTPIPIAGGVAGSGGIFPARWATTFLVRRSIILRAEFDNLDLGNPNTVDIILGGRKISYAT
jgi:hypothetical protein